MQSSIKNKIFLALSFLLPLSARAFIPPVGSVLKEIFDSRRPGISVELVFKHQVDLANGSSVAIDESLIYLGGKTYFLWKTQGHVPVYGVQDRKAYVIGIDRKLATRSYLFSKYLGTSSAEDFKELLVAEQFARRDQFLQYKPGFVFEGDPASWDVQGNYLKHPDIQLKKLESSIAIAVKGYEEGQNQKTLYLDHKLQGIKRIEWKEASNVTSWNFSDFNRYQDGLFPRRLAFEQNGNELIRSDLVQVRGLKDKAITNTIQSWQKTGGRNAATGSLEEALKVLLSYR